MTKPKLAVLSSYDELCGIATYTSALLNQFTKYYDTTVVPLNPELLRTGESSIAKKHIKDICNKLKDFDVVNIQFDGGLFGNEPGKILKRSMAIAQSCKKLVLTMHQVPPIEKYPSFKRLVNAYLGKKLELHIKELRTIYANNRHVKSYHKLIRYCKAQGYPVILHTGREAKLLRVKLDYDHIYDHPLCFHSQEYIQAIKANSSKAEFLRKYGLSENKIYLGIFGFISDYKAHETVIKTLEYLPENYELIVFGSQHPNFIKLKEKINPYIKKLMDLINEKKHLTSRVKFCGSLNDDDFLKALIWCDFNILPYLEVNQGGSGIAALSLEVGTKTIFAQNKAFIELAKYAPDSFKMFTIGNYMELAHAILHYSPSTYQHHLEKYWAKYNIGSNMHLYRTLISNLLGEALPAESEFAKELK
jgi:glycosyltransferase involved in cell wall biosynthesis